MVADALHYAHERGVIHRDVKPSNIMLDEQGRPHLMDFGLARREGEVLITIAGQILGTPAYMSPEQAEGRTADAKSDIYCLGVVLYELLTGQRPFQGNVQSVLQQVINAQPPSPIMANRAVPRDLEKICLKCMQKLASDRYESAREQQEDLSRFLEGLPVRARPISAGTADFGVKESATPPEDHQPDCHRRGSCHQPARSAVSSLPQPAAGSGRGTLRVEQRKPTARVWKSSLSLKATKGSRGGIPCWPSLGLPPPWNKFRRATAPSRPRIARPTGDDSWRDCG